MIVRWTRSTLVIVVALALLVAPARAQSGAPGELPASAAQTAPAPPAAADVPGPVAPMSLAAPAPEAPSPLFATSPPAKRVPLARHWWFWASLGAAAVGVVIAAITLGPRDPYSGNASPGIVPVF